MYSHYFFSNPHVSMYHHFSYIHSNYHYQENLDLRYILRKDRNNRQSVPHQYYNVLQYPSQHVKHDLALIVSMGQTNTIPVSSERQNYPSF
ncbi:hypothetical protein D3C86_1263390 [compost metagenome]